MDSSNNPELATESATLEAASPNDEVIQTETQAAEPKDPPAAEAAPPKDPTLQEKIHALKTEPAAATPAVVPGAPAAPKFEPNFKYKAFGKEKELDELFRPLIKDADTEKKVKDVFTRADAFDDMKTQKEAISYEHQRVSQAYSTLDRDVRKITNFLNKGDLDNFFASVRLTDEQLLRHLQQKAEIAKLSPMQQQAYQEATSIRQQQFEQQENMEQMQANFANQAVLTRTMQLDLTLGQPHVAQMANSYDSKMGQGSFRNLVAEVAANHWHTTKQDLPADAAVQMTIQKFGKLLESPAPQAPVVPAAGQPGPQAPQPVVGAKPVIPNVQGRGGSPIKQSPKSLDELRKMSKKLQMAELNPELD